MFPPLLGLVADASNMHIGMVVPLAGFVIAWSFPVYLNFFKAQELDGYLKSKVGIKSASTSSREVDVGHVDEKVKEVTA